MFNVSNCMDTNIIDWISYQLTIEKSLIEHETWLKKTRTSRIACKKNTTRIECVWCK